MTSEPSDTGPDLELQVSSLPLSQEAPPLDTSDQTVGEVHPQLSIYGEPQFQTNTQLSRSDLFSEIAHREHPGSSGPVMRVLRSI